VKTKLISFSLLRMQTGSVTNSTVLSAPNKASAEVATHEISATSFLSKDPLPAVWVSRPRFSRLGSTMC